MSDRINARTVLLLGMLLVALALLGWYRWQGPAPNKEAKRKFEKYLTQVEKIEKQPRSAQRCEAYPNLAYADWPDSLMDAFCEDTAFQYLKFSQLQKMLDSETPFEIDDYYDDIMQRFSHGQLPEWPLHASLLMPFGNRSQAVGEFVKKWNQLDPQSPYALAARGIYRLEKAWQAWGSRYEGDNPKEQISRAKALARAAQLDFNQALDLKPGLLTCYLELMSVSQLLDLDAGKILARGLAVYPDSYNLRYAYMKTIRPDWHGSIPAMLLFVVKSRLLAGSNPRMRAIEVPLVTYFNPGYYWRKQYLQAFEWEKNIISIYPSLDNMDVAAYSAYKAGRYRDAYKLYTQILRFYPDRLDSRRWRATVLDQLGYHDLAIQDLKACVDEAPDDVDILAAYAYGLFVRKDYAEAVEELKKVLSVNPDDQWSSLSLASIYVLRLNKPEQAKAILDPFLKAHPHSSWAWELIANYYDGHKETEKARQALLNVMKYADPFKPQEAGQLQEAESWLKRHPG